MKSIDFIVPVYQNQGSIIPTYMQIKKSFSNLNYDFNVIFINDGSTDYSKNEIISLVNKNKKVKLIDLAKNYGQVNAIIAGFTFSSADLVITISADLQDPINEIVNYLKNMHKQSKKVVVFARKTRNDGYFKNLISSIVWKIIKYVTKLNFPKGGFDTFLMAREIKDKLILYADKDNFLQGLLLTVYPNPHIVYYDRKKREIGKSQWTFIKKLNYFYSAIFEYSDLPLKTLGLISLFSLLLSVGFIIWIFYISIMVDIVVKGWLSIACISSITISLVSSGLWITSKYMSEIMRRNTKKPIFIVNDE